MNQTINYYNNNADSFVEGTKNVDFTTTQNKFLDKLPKLPTAAKILDFGCGSGRDTKYFLDQGHQVTATDGSEELCRLATEYTGIPVKHMLFQELNEVNVYDGIWACSSILHLPSEKLTKVLRKMRDALKQDGIMYASFKYGTFEGERNGRYFTDMTEVTFASMLEDIDGLVLEELWITSDVRHGRGVEQWLNVILRRK